VQRPLDNPGFHIAGAVAGIYDDTSENTKPKVSGLVSTSNADGSLGALLSFVHYRRDHAGQAVDTEGWMTNDAGVNGIAIPRNVVYRVINQNRTRSGINGAFDWKPSETFKLGMDAMYSRYKIDTVANFLAFFSDPADVEEIVADANGTAISYVRGNTGILSTDHILSTRPLRDSTNQQIGANLAWQLGEATTLDIDGSWSKAEDDTGGRGYFTVMGTRNVGVNPVWHLNPGGFSMYDPDTLLPITQNTDLRAHFARHEGDTLNDELGEFKTSLTRSFYDGVLSRLQFGLSASTRTKQNRSQLTPDELTCAYCGYVSNVPASLSHTVNFGRVIGAPGPLQWLVYDPEEYFAWLSSEAAWSQVLPGGSLYNPDDPERGQRIMDALERYGPGFVAIDSPLNGWKVREKNYAAYAQANFEGDWGMMPWQLDIGVRYIRTDIASSAVSAQVEAIIGNPGDPTDAQVRFTEPVPISRRSSYHDWLPSLNFRLNLRNDIVLRASLSQTLTRPTLTNLRANESIGVRPPGPGFYNTGNVDLKPYTAKNADLGIEWYLNDTSYLALAGFYKNVSNFIAQITVPTTILGYPFQQTLPVNADTAIIKGAELSFQYTFDRLPAPWDGFGVQVNYTAVDSQQTFDPSIVSGQFAVVGLSDSGNLVLFYEKDRFGIRAAYNWRDEYLAAVRGAQGEPTTVNAYDQWDLSSNFKLNERLSIFVDATNLTGEKESAYSRYKNRVQWMADNGRTITVGIRGSW